MLILLSCIISIFQDIAIFLYKAKDNLLPKNILDLFSEMPSTVLCKSNANDNRRISRISQYIGDI